MVSPHNDRTAPDFSLIWDDGEETTLNHTYQLNGSELKIIFNDNDDYALGTDHILTDKPNRPTDNSSRPDLLLVVVYSTLTFDWLMRNNACN